MPEALVSDGALWFSVPAIVGSIFFALRLIFLFAGGGDLGVDADFDLDHGDPTETFKVLSIQSIAAFLMGFGWGAIAGLRAFEWTWLNSLFLGLACGVAMMWILGLLLKGVHDLQASGNIQVEHAIGAEGTVYASIPASGEGRGQVQVVVDGRQRIYNAVSEADALPSHSRIRVVRVNEDRSLTVTKV
jgi:hypothetical protein